MVLKQRKLAVGEFALANGERLVRCLVTQKWPTEEDRAKLQRQVQVARQP